MPIVPPGASAIGTSSPESSLPSPSQAASRLSHIPNGCLEVTSPYIHPPVSPACLDAEYQSLSGDA